MHYSEWGRAVWHGIPQEACRFLLTGSLLNQFLCALIRLGLSYGPGFTVIELIYIFIGLMYVCSKQTELISTEPFYLLMGLWVSNLDKGQLE